MSTRQPGHKLSPDDLDLVSTAVEMIVNGQRAEFDALVVSSGMQSSRLLRRKAALIAVYFAYAGWYKRRFTSRMPRPAQRAAILDEIGQTQFGDLLDARVAAEIFDRFVGRSVERGLRVVPRGDIAELNAVLLLCAYVLATEIRDRAGFYRRTGRHLLRRKIYKQEFLEGRLDGRDGRSWEGAEG